ncbi:hypothetical protein EIK56_14260 [Sphingomonas sp. C8-2]|nr:hypothetical protein EIK56_14260 [Sphingomonas sp. C8-2]
MKVDRVGSRRASLVQAARQRDIFSSTSTSAVRRPLTDDLHDHGSIVELHRAALSADGKNEHTIQREHVDTPMTEISDRLPCADSTVGAGASP